MKNMKTIIKNEEKEGPPLNTSLARYEETKEKRSRVQTFTIKATTTTTGIPLTLNYTLRRLNINDVDEDHFGEDYQRAISPISSFSGVVNRLIFGYGTTHNI